MKWLNKLEYYDLSFNVKIIYKNECIIADKKIDEYNTLIILDGFMQKTQIFTNGEMITLKLLYKTDIFTNIKTEPKSSYLRDSYYYQFKALTNTIIIIINKKELEKRTEKKHFALHILNQSHYHDNNEMVQILSHKNIKKRIVQFLLILIKHFGKISRNTIYIPFNLSHNDIAVIIGCQRVTVNRVMNKLKPNIIYYDDHRIIIFNLTQLIQS